MMKQTKKFSAILLIAVLLSMSTIVVQATEIMTFNGNLSEPVLRISNIIGKDTTFSKVYDTGYEREAYLCQAPVTVELLMDEMCFFPANQMIPFHDELYPSSINIYPVGYVAQYHYDKATGETTTSYVHSDQLEELDLPSYAKGATITITKPGVFEVGALFEAVYEGIGGLYLNIIGEAQPTTARVYVDGVEKDFEAYNIADNNYFKLRDIAMAISGSEKQFNVTWDTENQAINLLSKTPYTIVGGEFTKGDMTAKTAKATASHMYKDGEGWGFTSYTIGDNNYFLLRDLGEVFDFGVSWDAGTGSIHIDTTCSYAEG